MPSRIRMPRISREQLNTAIEARREGVSSRTILARKRASRDFSSLSNMLNKRQYLRGLDKRTRSEFKSQLETAGARHKGQESRDELRGIFRKIKEGNLGTKLERRLRFNSFISTEAARRKDQPGRGQTLVASKKSSVLRRENRDEERELQQENNSLLQREKLKNKLLVGE